MNEAQKALKELYDLLVEYDMESAIVDAADEADREAHTLTRDEYAHVVGIFEGVRIALGVSAWQQQAQS